MRQLSLHVVGAAHPNKDGRGDRRFEILLCVPGEPIRLVAEPKNPVDPHAIAVFSMRDVQIGYLTADRAAWISSMLRSGREVQAIFQQATQFGAAIRISLDGDEPVLPTATVPRPTATPGDDPDFWPDYIPPDD